MKRVLKKYVIPHEGNNHTPHLLREAGAFALLLIIVGLFGVAASMVDVLKSSNLAAVVSPVLVDLTNADRQTQNLSPLKINSTLTKIAQDKADDMAAKGYFAHVSPDGLSPWYWFDLEGYKFLYAGENLAVNFSESTDVENAWMNSPGHRSNILNDRFTEVGIATQSGTYQGQTAIFVAQEFGKPMPAAVAYSYSTKKSSQTTSSKIAISSTTKATTTIAKTSTSTASTSLALNNSTDAGKVKSAATSSASSESLEDAGPQYRTLVSDDMFVAVQNIGTTSATINTQDIQSPTAGTTAASYAHAIQKIITQPKNVLQFAYGLIAALVLITMGLTILGEYRRHHMRNVSYGVGLLVAMVILMYALTTLIPQVIVV